MRRALATVAALALVTVAAASARAAEKLHLERFDLKNYPTTKMYLSLIDGEGHPITGRAKEDFKLILDSAEQGAATAVQSFEESKDPINLVVVAQVNSAMNEVIDDERRGIGMLADALPPKSKMALLGYAADTKRLAEMGAAADAQSAAKTMAIDADSVEPHMLDAVRIAMDLLNAAPKGERKLIVVFSDGIDIDNETRSFNSIGKRAADAEIVIDTIGYNTFDTSKLHNIGQLARQSQGSERTCKGPSDISANFNAVADEVKKQYIVTFEASTAGGDGKDHLVQVVASQPGGRDSYSNTVGTKLPKPVHPTAKKGGGGNFLVWLLVILGALALVGGIAFLVFREKPEAPPEPEAAPAPAPVAAAQPQMPMKTMALDVSAGGSVAVGWIVATSGKYADQTFKLKPSRTVIGTGTDCDIKVEDQFMSSKHCEVRFENGSYKLFDLGSTNGIVVNDKKVREHELVDNDLFKLGRTEFKFKSIS